MTKALGDVQDCFVGNVEREGKVTLLGDPTIHLQNTAIEQSKCLLLEAGQTDLS